MPGMIKSRLKSREREFISISIIISELNERKKLLSGKSTDCEKIIASLLLRFKYVRRIFRNILEFIFFFCA